MSWIADLHIHSHFSMATSKDCNPQNLRRWAGLKGVSLVGTGDFTHPGWRQELRENLVATDSGLYRFKEPFESEVPLQPDCQFIVTGELSTIYKKDGKVRKVHHLVVLPSLEDADRISDRLEALGMNIRSDGRPILGLDSYRLFALILDTCPDAILIPAHIWTPHFSVFGSNSGFDDITECYGDLTQYIYALETGLSSDPAMNWRWSALDRFTLVSNSDAHNPQNLAREANLFDTEFSYAGLKAALQEKTTVGFGGTIEFFPEEGKYHYDGHRNCEVCWQPDETNARQGICPVCGRRVTVGVLHRVAELADRPVDYIPNDVKPFVSLVPLREVIGSAVKAGSTSKKVQQIYFNLLHKFGPELTILQTTDLDDLYREAGPLVAEGIRRLRTREVEIKPGFDGEYGIISVLREDDRQVLLGQAALFEAGVKQIAERRLKRSLITEVLARDIPVNLTQPDQTTSDQINTEQQSIVYSSNHLSVVIAGPGTGKTRTLVERIVYLVNEKKIAPETITAVTFTNKAARELNQRLQRALPKTKTELLNVGTFHSLAWKILKLNPTSLPPKLLNEFEARDILDEVLRQNRIPLTARDAALTISLLKNKWLWEEGYGLSGRNKDIYQAYQQSLHDYGRWDFDDVMIQAVQLWADNPDWLEPHRAYFQNVLVDEFQDVNAVQYRLIKHWMMDSQTVMLIGDPNQSIYGFRGADANYFQKIQNDFRESVVCRLTHNYRSPKSVINAANALIPNEYRQQNLRDDSAKSYSVIQRVEAQSEAIAARAIVSEIVNLVGGATMISAHNTKGRTGQRLYSNETFGFGDIAILYRTGRQAEFLEKYLSGAGLPYKVSGQSPTLETPVVKEFLAFFHYLVEPNDLFLLRTVLQYPRWEFSTNEIYNLTLFLKGKEDFTREFDKLPDNFGLELPIKIHRFVEKAADYRKCLDQSNLVLLTKWQQDFNLTDALELDHLKRLSEDYQNIKDFITFLPLALEADLTRRSDHAMGTEVISLSTLHAVKGLEFPVVFIFGVEEGRLPYGTNPTHEIVAEEQRLFYVGVTRAQQRLFLVNSLTRFGQGDRAPVEPSRFLTLLPENLISKIEITHRTQAKQLELFE